METQIAESQDRGSPGEPLEEPIGDVTEGFHNLANNDQPTTAIRRRRPFAHPPTRNRTMEKQNQPHVSKFGITSPLQKKINFLKRNPPPPSQTPRLLSLIARIALTGVFVFFVIPLLFCCVVVVSIPFAWFTVKAFAPPPARSFPVHFTFTPDPLLLSDFTSESHIGRKGVAALVQLAREPWLVGDSFVLNCSDPPTDEFRIPQKEKGALDDWAFKPIKIWLEITHFPLDLKSGVQWPVFYDGPHHGYPQPQYPQQPQEGKSEMPKVRIALDSFPQAVPPVWTSMAVPTVITLDLYSSDCRVVLQTERSHLALTRQLSWRNLLTTFAFGTTAMTESRILLGNGTAFPLKNIIAARLTLHPPLPIINANLHFQPLPQSRFERFFERRHLAFALIWGLYIAGILACLSVMVLVFLFK